MLSNDLLNLFSPRSNHLVNNASFFQKHECWHCLHSPILSNGLNINNTQTNNTNSSNIKVFPFQVTDILMFLGGFFFFTFNSSTSTLRKVTSECFFASSTRNGVMNRHGPHHEAVKSITICEMTSIENLRTTKPNLVAKNYMYN